MPAPDPAILDMILAENYAGANAALEADHPQAFLDTIGATAIRAIAAADATSGSSNSIGSSGTKTFTLDEARGWKAGTPVYIMEDGAPTSNFMTGHLDSDETAGKVISVTINSGTGSGTFTAWTILALFSVTTVASPPLAIADGGTGSSTAALARAAFEVVRVFSVLDVLSTPPGSPSTGDAYIVASVPTGAWIGETDKIATWNGSSWDFTTPNIGDQAYVAASAYRDEQMLYQGGVVTDGTHIYGNGVNTSKWKSMTRSPHLKRVTKTGSVTLTSDESNLAMIATSSLSGDATITIPDEAVLNGGRRLWFVNEDTTHDMIINVESSGTINGGASITLQPGECVAMFEADENTWWHTGITT